MGNTYELKIGPLTRYLPLMPINENTNIASFILLGDVELTEYAANELAKKLEDVDFDYIVTMESKGITLAHVLSRVTGHKRYVVLRKSVKNYMQNVIMTTVNSITTKGEQRLVLNGADADLIRGKKVILADDVISTGESLAAAEVLVEKVGATVCKKIAVLAEGDAIGRTDIEYLEPLPLFKRH